MTLYKELYLRINKKDDYQRICPLAPLRTPCEQPENNKSMGIKTRTSLSRKVAYRHDPEADSMLG